MNRDKTIRPMTSISDSRLLTFIISHALTNVDLVGSGPCLRLSQTYIGSNEQKRALVLYEKATKGQDIS